MGALRAAELEGFGMIGCGAIYRAYADGRITGDDEVAVLHAPAALGAAPLSLAQVNVRATLCRAVRTRVLNANAARHIRDRSAAIHYRDRDWAGVLHGYPACSASVMSHAVDIKASDAQHALALAAQLVATQPIAPPAPPLTPFLARLAAAVTVEIA